MKQSTRPTAAVHILQNIPAVRRTGETLLEADSPIARTLLERLSPAGTGATSAQMPPLSLLRLAMMAERGGIFHDLAGASSSREQSQWISTAALSIISVADHHVDELGRNSRENVTVLSDLLAAITDGHQRDMPPFSCSARPT